MVPRVFGLPVKRAMWEQLGPAVEARYTRLDTPLWTARVRDHGPMTPGTYGVFLIAAAVLGGASSLARRRHQDRLLGLLAGGIAVALSGPLRIDAQDQRTTTGATFAAATADLARLPAAVGPECPSRNGGIVVLDRRSGGIDPLHPQPRSIAASSMSTSTGHRGFLTASAS